MDQSYKQLEVKRAIENNIALCERVAIANGVHPVSVDGVWMSLQPMPPYYPNLITTVPKLDISKHLEKLNGLLSPGWGVKDSYSDLDLPASRFRVAVSGNWFSVLINADSHYSLSDNSNVIVVQSESQFTRWVSAWDPAMEGKIFPADIWRKDDLRFVLVERNNQVVGGFLLNGKRCDIGLSNWFGELDVVSSALSKVIASSQRVVGYANGEELNALSGFGFEPLQAMKVWISH